MREIVFRGKRKETGEWAEGFYLPFGDEEYIITPEQLAKGLDVGGWLNGCKAYEVLPETVSLFTGSYDKNKKRIFEGDLVELRDLHAKDVVLFMEIVHCNGTFGVDPGGKFFRLTDLLRRYEATVVGNIHDSPMPPTISKMETLAEQE